jgi:hypothetical protein
MRYQALLTATAALLLVLAPVAHAQVVISSEATRNMTCSGGVCAPTAAEAVLNVTALQNLLASGKVVVTTTGSGVQADDIEIKARLSWSSTSMLALDAYDSIAIGKPVSVAGLDISSGQAL